MHHLIDLGWNDHFDQAFQRLHQKNWIPGRLSRETKINFTALIDEGKSLDVVVSGKLWHDARIDTELPAVGDWVAIDPGKPGDEPVIRAILPRQTQFSRKTPGKSCAEQVIAANVDIVVVVTEPGTDFNLRRMERYLSLIHKSGAHPIIILNKIDIYPEKITAKAIQELRSLDPETPIISISALHQEGIEALRENLNIGTTLTVVGSSGVGKSTLVNSLFGTEYLHTGAVNQVTGKGRHTTVARELLILPTGGILIDNPGMREIQMWTDEQTLRESFSDLTQLASQCRFADCRHGNDAGCAIRAAVSDGILSEERYNHFLNLENEIKQLNIKQEKRRMTIERVQKRSRKVQARNYEDRLDWERQQNPNKRSGHH